MQAIVIEQISTEVATFNTNCSRN